MNESESIKARGRRRLGNNSNTWGDIKLNRKGQLNADGSGYWIDLTRIRTWKDVAFWLMHAGGKPYINTDNLRNCFLCIFGKPTEFKDCQPRPVKDFIKTVEEWK